MRRVMLCPLQSGADSPVCQDFCGRQECLPHVGASAMPASHLSRRSFLAHSAAGAAALAAPSVLRAQNTNSRLNLGFIASGGRARANLSEMTRPGGVDVNIVALCDVNGQNLDQAAQKYPKARVYKDFRKLLDEAKDLDGIVVSTCEHTHAYASVPALQMGK